MPLSDNLRDALSAVTSTKDSDVLVKLSDALDQEIETRVEKRLSDISGYRPVSDQHRKFLNLRSAWRENGLLPTGARVSIQEMIKADKQRLAAASTMDKPEEKFGFSDGAFYWDNPQLIPRVIADVVREPLPEVLTISPLFKDIRMTGPGTSVVFPAVSALHAGDLEIAEGGLYPEGNLEWAGTVTAAIGKHGIAVRFTEEAIKYSQYDIMGLHLRGAGTALARHRETLAWRNMAQGSIFTNNGDVAARKTTGRDIDGVFNGTFSLYDLLAAYGDMLNQGFIPDVLIMHPMAWTIFAEDPSMRAFAYAQGGMLAQRYQGEVAMARQWSNGQLNNNTLVTDPKQVQTTYAPVPGIFPYPLRIIVSPFVDFDATKNTTTIILADSNEIGIRVVFEDITTDEYKDPERDIYRVKLKERYGFATMNQGLAVRQFKKVVIARSYNLDEKLEWLRTGTVPTGLGWTPSAL